jgi:hypothetical protein
MRFSSGSGSLLLSITIEEGFFLAETAEELSAYLRAFDHRLSQMQKTRLALGVALALEQGQQTVEGWNNG